MDTNWKVQWTEKGCEQYIFQHAVPSPDLKWQGGKKMVQRSLCIQLCIVKPLWELAPGKSPGSWWNDSQTQKLHDNQSAAHTWFYKGASWYPALKSGSPQAGKGARVRRHWKHELWNQMNKDFNLAPPYPRCVTLSRALHLSDLSYVKSNNNVRSYCEE